MLRHLLGFRETAVNKIARVLAILELTIEQFSKDRSLAQSHTLSGDLTLFLEKEPFLFSPAGFACMGPL